MKKISVIGLLAILVAFTGVSVTFPEKGEAQETAATGIEFDHLTFEEAKAKALEENKLIFIDAYTSWCGPCKRMAANVFTNEAVGAYFNENFINLKIDMEKGEGPAIGRKYRVAGYPTLLFVDETARLKCGQWDTRTRDLCFVLPRKQLPSLPFL